MKRRFTFIEFIVAIAIIAIMAGMMFGACGCDIQQTTKAKERAAQGTTLDRAAAATPIPEVNYFQERRTIAKWTNRWDKPNLPCYVYLVSYGNIIGYYVTDGKPASTRSYILPEYSHWVGSSGASELIPSADIDGTYGENNPGIRFFTADGTAVEWGGSGASYIYSDAPLPIKVPKLNRQ